MLRFGVVVLGVTDRPRAEEFWSAALGYQVREGPFGGWARVLASPEDGAALERVKVEVEALCRKFPLYPEA